ncbi:MAG: flagellar biosynthesis protein FlhF, partial [Phycisphaerae bacterium]
LGRRLGDGSERACRRSVGAFAVGQDGEMNLKTYRGRSMAEALAQVKQDLGKDAVILHTRATRVGAVMGVGGHDEFEITASDAATVMGPKLREAPASATLPPSSAAAIRERAAFTYENDRQRNGDRREDSFATATFTTIGANRGSSAVAASDARVESGGTTPRTPAAPTTTLIEPKPALAAGNATLQGVSVMAAAAGSKPAAVAPAPATTKPEAMPSRTTGTKGLATSVELAPADSAAVETLKSELGSIRTLMSQLLSETRRGGMTGGAGGLAGLATAGMTPPLAEMYLLLQDVGVRSDLVEKIIGAVRDELHGGELTDASVVRASVERQLAAMMPCAGGLPKAGKRVHAASGFSRPLTIALVGPTGVGKTTTIAKLAAAYKLRHHVRVGLITCDTYRIAAVEQLRTYANIIDLPLKVCLTPREVGEACQSLMDCDVVLLDTAGRSQHDAARIDELAGFIDAASADETHLVLSSVMAEDVLTSAARRFSVLKPNNLILTKLDEAVRFGVVPTVCANVGLKLSFLTTGQEVPEHIELAHPPRLARLVLDGKLRP